MSFTTPCFIRKNTPEIRKKLEKLGYAPSSLPHLDILITTHGLFFSIYKNISDEVDAIDCGTNTDLFLAIATLRDDTSINQ